MRNILKLILFTLSIFAFTGKAHAQSADSVYDKYVDFNLARFEDRTADAFKLGAEVMPVSDKLPPKSRISFFNSMAKLYEDNSQFDKAQPLYEQVAAAEPDYYVVHLALGYIYLRPADELAAKLKASEGDKQAYKKNFVVYKYLVDKALPHLLKAQACDPNDETLALINTLYKNTSNTKGLASLNAELNRLSKNCITVLNDN